MRVSDDLLLGAGAIAKEVFGKDTKANRRKVYHLDEVGALPTFRLGKQLALRPSALRKRIDQSERERMAAVAAE
jgi:hypothetical protein